MKGRRGFLALLPAGLAAPLVGAGVPAVPHRLPRLLVNQALYHTMPEPELLHLGWQPPKPWAPVKQPGIDGRWLGWWYMIVSGVVVASPFDAELSGGQDAARWQLLSHVRLAMQGHPIGYVDYGVSLVEDGGVLPLPMSWAPESWKRPSPPAAGLSATP
jgi:hypothetical protein